MLFCNSAHEGPFLCIAVATATIIALAISILTDLSNEAGVYREVATAQQVKDQQHALRAEILDLRAAARLGARTGDAGAFANIERRAKNSRLQTSRCLAVLVSRISGRYRLSDLLSELPIS